MKSIIYSAFLISLLSLFVNAQFGERVTKTFDNSLTSAIAKALLNKSSQSNGKNNSSALKFTPNGDSGVKEALADALGQDANQKAALAEAFQQIKQGYEAEAAKEGKSNSLAAAFAFFIAANVMIYGQTEIPSDKVTDELFKDLQNILGSVPEFIEMTDGEKQKMHDWLVCMGGFALSNYLDGKQNNDAQALANIKTFADYSLRLVLGIEAQNLKFSANGFQINSANSAKASSQLNSKIVGTWSRKAAVNSSVVTNAGYYVCRYNFNSNGTYTFKSEMWNGYLRSEEWWTTEENGTFSVNGNTLTISPTKSVATARNRAGAVQKTQNNQLEIVTYNWKTHFYEGINETVLILKPSAQTKRDGTFGGDSNFPNSYIYDQTSLIEWKF